MLTADNLLSSHADCLEIWEPQPLALPLPCKASSDGINTQIGAHILSKTAYLRIIRDLEHSTALLCSVFVNQSSHPTGQQRRHSLTAHSLLPPSLSGPSTSIAGHAITTNNITPKLGNLQMCSVDTPLSTVIKSWLGRSPLVTTQHQHSEDCHPLLQKTIIFYPNFQKASGRGVIWMERVIM